MAYDLPIICHGAFVQLAACHLRDARERGELGQQRHQHDCASVLHSPNTGYEANTARRLVRGLVPRNPAIQLHKVLAQPASIINSDHRA